MKGKGR